MDLATFLALDDDAVATALRTRSTSCWAVAMGGTRRAYIAAGGVLAGSRDLADYLRWVDAAHRTVLSQLFGLGVQTIISVERVPRDRGPAYQAMARDGLLALATGQARRAFYADHHLRLNMRGDLGAVAKALAAPELVDQFESLAAETAAADGPNLIYLFRGDWADPAVEEAHFGYRLGSELGRPPTRTELVRSYYGTDVPPLSLYVGSGRPQLGQLRPPFLGGGEDLYWSQSPLMRLEGQDWRNIIYDSLWSRRTESARQYAMDAQSRWALGAAMAASDGQILGIGTKHPLGFWTAAQPLVEREVSR